MTDEKIKYVRQWLEKADEDLRGYSIYMKDEDPPYALAGFQLQQAAEKNLKAFLEYHNVAFPKTHDIEFLLKECSQKNASFNKIKFDNISDYAVDLRYPGDMEPPTKDELENALILVEEIRLLVISLIKF